MKISAEFNFVSPRSKVLSRLTLSVDTIHENAIIKIYFKGTSSGNSIVSLFSCHIIRSFIVVTD